MTLATSLVMRGRAPSMIARRLRTRSLRPVQCVQFVRYWLGARKVGDRCLERRQKARRARGPWEKITESGSRIDVNQPPVDLAVGRPSMNGRNRLSEGPVVEHAAIDETGVSWIDVALQVSAEALLDEALALRPVDPALRNGRVDLDDSRWRKCPWKRRGRPRGESESRTIGKIEVVLDLPVLVTPIPEMRVRDGAPSRARTRDHAAAIDRVVRDSR